MGGRNGLARFMPALWIDCVVSGLMEREVYRWRGGGVESIPPRPHIIEWFLHKKAIIYLSK